MKKIEKIKEDVYIHPDNTVNKLYDISIKLNELIEVVNTLIEKKEERWKPEKGDKYYYIYVDGSICDSVYDNDIYDKMRLNFGNYFKTLEAAESARDKVKALLLGL